MFKIIMKDKPNYNYLEKYGIISIEENENNGTYTIILEDRPF